MESVGVCRTDGEKQALRRGHSRADATPVAHTESADKEVSRNS